MEKENFYEVDLTCKNCKTNSFKTKIPLGKTVEEYCKEAKCWFCGCVAVLEMK